MGAPSVIAAPLRRDEALAFIIERIVRTGICPTLDEIATALSVSKPRVRELIDQLVERKYLERVAGSQRNLRVRDLAHCRSIANGALRSLGWPVADPLQPLQYPPLPNVQLPVMPPFEHLPEFE